MPKNGYYGSLVSMVRDAFLDLVPCILVTFDKEQVVIWRGKDYKPTEGDGEYPPSFIHHESSKEEL
ncbi:hypothetical protein Bca52824_061660 [Brassica carinata]|uniref:Uncharacterized protein n=1 Tax=Brassica carinata TaxID=52824 RepID=A0A8X7UGP6_BRACI|nr:hypothetical protein Bca52824_061660 [Brassica carinata]